MSQPFHERAMELVRSDVSASAKVLWVALSCYGNGSGNCFPSISTLAKDIGRKPRQVSSLIGELELAGFVRTERSVGVATHYFLDTPAINCTTQSIPLQFSAPPPCNKLQDPPAINCMGSPDTHAIFQHDPCNFPTSTPAINCTLPKRRVPKKEVPKNKRATPAVPKPTKIKTFEDVEQAINSIDIAEFVAKYPSCDVLGEFENFKAHHLFKNDLRTGKPNWQKWSDWPAAFHTWMRNVQKWGERTFAVPQKPQKESLLEKWKRVNID